jgi:hypothetical protein
MHPFHILVDDLQEVPQDDTPTRPVFFVYLDDCLTDPSPIGTGTLTTTLDLDDGDEVLLMDSIFDPMLSVIAKVHYLYNGIDGAVYHYSFRKSDIGAASIYI